MVSSSRGNRTELAVAAELREAGHLVASLRRTAGAGDQLAWKATVPVPLLVEVKGTRDLPWRSVWGPVERLLMVNARDEYLVEPILAWRPPGLGGTIWLPPEDWPLVTGNCTTLSGSE